jgi:hypothetical protein
MNGIDWGFSKHRQSKTGSRVEVCVMRTYTGVTKQLSKRLSTVSSIPFALGAIMRRQDWFSTSSFFPSNESICPILICRIDSIRTALFTTCDSPGISKTPRPGRPERPSGSSPSGIYPFEQEAIPVKDRWLGTLGLLECHRSDSDLRHFHGPARRIYPFWRLRPKSKRLPIA